MEKISGIFTGSKIVFRKNAGKILIIIADKVKETGYSKIIYNNQPNILCY